MRLVVILFLAAILAMYSFGLYWTHIVIIVFFGSSIFFGALVIADTDEEEKEVKGEG
jgi:hypothetical protein